MYAVKHGHCAIAKLLLDKGADVNTQGGYFGNALHAATCAGNNEVLERLIERDSIRQLHDSYGLTLLWWAAAGGQTTNHCRVGTP
jgi:ankyrin repeat protein